SGVHRDQSGDAEPGGSAVLQQARDGRAVDQRGKASGEDDPTLLSPFSLEPSAAGSEPAGLQPGEFVAAASAAQANRELVAHEFTATAGEDGGTAGETCPLLLAAIGGEPPDERVVWQYAPADRRAVASGGIAGAVGAGKSIQSQEGTEGCLTRPDGKAVVSSCGTRIGPDGTVSRALGPARENICALEFLKGYIVLKLSTSRHLAWQKKRLGIFAVAAKLE